MTPLTRAFCGALLDWLNNADHSTGGGCCLDGTTMRQIQNDFGFPLEWITEGLEALAREELITCTGDRFGVWITTSLPEGWDA